MKMYSLHLVGLVHSLEPLNLIEFAFETLKENSRYLGYCEGSIELFNL